MNFVASGKCAVDGRVIERGRLVGKEREGERVIEPWHGGNLWQESRKGYGIEREERGRK